MECSYLCRGLPAGVNLEYINAGEKSSALAFSASIMQTFSGV